ncbi:MAG: ATP-binding protein, partial [Alphaproteobacteria bacterium]
GFTNAAASILVVSALIFLTALPIAYYAAKFGVDIDLLTRGAGFGYIGSTITSLIYASFTFIFFAIEAAIMALALEMCFGIPLAIGYLVSAAVVIPLVTHGITLISRFQLWTQPLWIGLHLLPFIFIGLKGAFSIDDWTSFHGVHGAADGSFNLLLFGAASCVVFSLVAQIGEQVDFLRFLPRQTRDNRVAWWTALVAGGPGWIVLGGLKLLLGSFLAVFAFGEGVSLEHAAEPTQMYRVAFQHVVATPEIVIGLTGFFVILSQLKINVTNAYAGSIAWSNFFSRLTHSHPGRVVWLVFNVAIALVLMEIGIFKALEHTLGLYSNVAVAWVGAIVADLVINKPLGLSPRTIEFKRAYLHDINPVGVGAMLIASMLSITTYSGLLGNTLQALSSFIALGTAFTAVPIIALVTRGRYYLARTPATADGDAHHTAAATQCCICEHHFEPEDMAHCPIYSGPICSLCCTLDARCHDACKVGARFSEQIRAFLSTILPERIVANLGTRLGQYCALMVLVCGISALFFGLIYLQATLDPNAPREVIGATLWNVFFILVIVAGVTCWLIVLANESRHVAQEESNRQANRLMREIRAHQRTDEQLQRAKEIAEAANQAKSRYMAGLSHELRTPLNTILGYAQIMEDDPNLPPRRTDSVRMIRRSAEHLAGLIEGLLDISKVEAGKLNIYRDEFRFDEFLDQLVDMFRVQATAKGLDFHFDRPESLPDVVHTDEKRVRQILINLLSNAIKCTDRGHVLFKVRYRGQVAEFTVEDTGIGIRESDIKHIFQPFVRIHEPSLKSRPGTGLGLTITRLLTEVLGGEITVESVYGKGSTFRVKLMLSAVRQPMPAHAVRRIYGYKGRRLTVVVADDDPDHRELINEILAPLGFIVLGAEDGPSCIELAAQCEPDLFLLDISMPGMNGWELAERLRRSGHDSTPIIIVSAVASGELLQHLGSQHHDARVAKPIRITELLDRMGRLLKIEWIRDLTAPAAEPDVGDIVVRSAGIPLDDVREMRELSRIGHVRALQIVMDDIGGRQPELGAVMAELRAILDRFDFEKLDSVLEKVQHEIAR